MGAVVALWLGADFMWNGAIHKGRGLLEVGGDTTPERMDFVSEATYKRNYYAMGGIFLLFGGMLMWHAVSNWKERDGLERTWVNLLSDPQKMADIEKNPQLYREDLREYIKQTTLDDHC